MGIFDKIYGQDYVKRYLNNSIKNDNLSNAYIFDGIEGCGKLTTAKTLAEYLTGTQLGSSSDISIYELESGTKTHKIDLIRSINSSIALKPYSDYKIVIINDADKLTIQAQNAFLKTLEEPPSFVIIILIVENRDALLSTIRSRCELVKFRPLSDRDIKSYLVNLPYDEDSASFVSKFSAGSISKAENLIESEDFRTLRKEVLNFSELLVEEDLEAKLALIDLLNDKRNSIDDFLDMALELFIDVYIYKRGINTRLISNIDNLNLIKRINESIGYFQLYRIIDIIEDTKKKLSSNSNFNITMHNMILSIDGVKK